MAIGFRELIKPAPVDDVEAKARRAQVAEALRMRALQPNMPVAGGPVEAQYGVGNALTDLANSLATAWSSKRADDEWSKARDQRGENVRAAAGVLQAAVPDDLVGATAAQRIKAAPDGMLAEPVTSRSQAQRGLATAMGPAGEAALAEALLGQSVKATDPTLLAEREDRQAARETVSADRKAALEQRLVELDMRLSDRALDREQRDRLQASADATRRELAMMMDATRRDLGALASEDRRRAADQSAEAKREADAAKADAATAKVTDGKQAVSSLVGELSSMYDTLDESGGIVSDERGAVSNVASSIQASPVGQFVGGAIGTKNQTARDSVTMLRPRLVAAIMQATGMSARQLDSNAELKLQLTAATDPSKGVQANRKAMEWIDKNYGLGGAAAPAPAVPAPGAAAAPGFDAEKEARYQAWKASQGQQ